MSVTIPGSALAPGDQPSAGGRSQVRPAGPCASDAKVGFKVEMVDADPSAGMNATTALNDSDRQDTQDGAVIRQRACADLGGIDKDTNAGASL